MEVATLGGELAQLREILRAKKRIADGSYGVCIDCGGTISSLRLEALPTAERCIDCQSAHEKSAGPAKASSL
ncbi:MAG: TraR/DksA family transcriptional regulator [Usitatibacteraceae bacterium]